MGRETGIKKIHPHQKPVELYIKILQKYAKPGDLILDTHLGSGSIAIACHNMGFDLTACEIDKEYYDNAMRRIKSSIAQKELFPSAELGTESTPELCFEEVDLFNNPVGCLTSLAKCSAFCCFLAEFV